MTADPVAIARDLIRCASVTPADAGAIGVLERLLGQAGFTVHRLTFSEPGTPDIDNLYARIGTAGPHLTFAGHTDVVPAGDDHAWSHGAFSGDVSDGALYGRGTVGANRFGEDPLAGADAPAVHPAAVRASDPATS